MHDMADARQYHSNSSILGPVVLIFHTRRGQTITRLHQACFRRLQCSSSSSSSVVVSHFPMTSPSQTCWLVVMPVFIPV
ncbi:hypothetical protein E2C01_034297 [Portunus trituberculatus]|uniref:Uncharacterized protein n=1 Tax=Portunus trituberculatus TaxID=210409 RepID=A0A5B7F197_PORTR|nr:hypothetical protein [Portunus trituberculatus]